MEDDATNTATTQLAYSQSPQTYPGIAQNQAQYSTTTSNTQNLASNPQTW
jgi:hypothetical protein